MSKSVCIKYLLEKVRFLCDHLNQYFQCIQAKFLILQEKNLKLPIGRKAELFITFLILFEYFVGKYEGH